MADPLAGLFDRSPAPSLSNFLKPKFNAAGQRVSIFDDSIGDSAAPEPAPESLIARAARLVSPTYHAIEEAPAVAANYLSPGGNEILSKGLTPRVPSISELVEHGGLSQDQIDNATYPEAIGRKVGGVGAELLTSPTNAAILAATGGLGSLAARGATARAALEAGGDFLVPEAAAAAQRVSTIGRAADLAGRGVSLGFAGQMAQGAGQKIGSAAERYAREGFSPGTVADIAGAGVDVGFAGLAGLHGVHSEAPLPPRTASIADANALHTEAPPVVTQPPTAPTVDATFQQASAPPPAPPAPVKGVDLTSDELARVQQAQVVQQQQAAQAQAAAQAQQVAALQPPPVAPPPTIAEPPALAPPPDNLAARDADEVGRLTRMIPHLPDADLTKRLDYYEKKGLTQSATAIRQELQARQPPPPAPEPIPLQTPDIAPQATQPVPAAVAPPTPEIVPPAQELAGPLAGLPAGQGEAPANVAPVHPLEAVLSKLPPEDRAVVENEIHAAKTTDPLTGLKNKYGWKELTQAVGPNDHVAVIDLKGFKAVNDTFGHDAADEVLGSVGGLIRKHFGDETARQGGDEFGAVLRDHTFEQAQAKVSAFNDDIRSMTHSLEGPNGQRIDIPAVEAHIGLAGGADAARRADLAANAHRVQQGSGRRVSDVAGGPDVPDLGRPVEGTPALPEPRVQDRSEQLAPAAPSNPADFQHLNNHAAIDREVDAAIPSAITALSHGSHEPGGKVFQGTEHLTTLAPGMHPAKVEYGLEDLPEGAKTIANALKRDKNNPLELRAKAAMAARFTEDLATRGDAHEPVGGDTSFNPDELEPAGAKYAVTQKTKAGEQHVIPGSLDGSLNQALRPEGREGEGPLFRQEEEARLQKEKESQGRLFRAAPEGEARPETGLSLEDVRKHVNAKDITETPDGFQFKVGPTGVRIDRVGDIHLEPQAFEAGRPGQDIEGMQAVGSYQRVGDLANIKLLAKVGETPRTLLHEVWHLVKDLGLLKPGEMRAVERKFGAGEEGQADAYADWKPAQTPNTLFSKIRSFFNGIYRAFRPSWESAFENVRSGAAFERSGNEAVPQGAESFATAPKVPPQVRPIPPEIDAEKVRAADKPLGRPMEEGEAPRVEAKVAKLREVSNAELSRDAPRTWESLDPEIAGKLQDIFAKPEKEKALYEKARSGKLNDVEVQTLDALVTGKREAYDNVRERLLQAQAAGRDTGPENTQYLGAALDRAAAELAVAARSDVEAGTKLGRALAARARVMDSVGEYELGTRQAVMRAKKQVSDAVDNNWADVIRRMKADGVLRVEC